jgi:DNA-binding SARP family transcriptional activator
VATRIYLTGRLAIEHDGTLILDEAAFPGRQGRLVFAFLAAAAHRTVPRAELAEVLWGDSPPREADTTLTAVLSRLRGLLRRIPSGADIAGQNGAIGLRFPADTWLDLEGAANALDEADGAQRRGDHAAAWSHANIAAVIARRPFLPSEEAPWIERQRRHLSSMLVRGLRCLSAVQYAIQVVDLDPLRESAHQHLMKLHLRTGDAAEALRVFAGCRKRLRDELGASPSPEISQLHLSILPGDLS